jgi:hypothetical protein
MRSLLNCLNFLLRIGRSDDHRQSNRRCHDCQSASLVVGVLAAYGPARRSLRIQPSEALRGD